MQKIVYSCNYVTINTNFGNGSHGVITAVLTLPTPGQPNPKHMRMITDSKGTNLCVGPNT